LNDYTGPGLVVQSGHNVTFELGGNTWTITGPLVGSSGTETQGFQLLKDSNITFQNGTIISNEEPLILIQNYSNLTLNNVLVDITNAPQCLYAVSNNNGTTTFTGSTSILAPGEKQVAFDTYYNPSSYPDGVTVVVNTSGEIRGKIEYGSQNGAADVADKATLNISSGIINGDFSTFGLNSTSDTGINLTGGIFTADLASSPVNVDADEIATFTNSDGDTATALGNKSINTTFGILPTDDIGNYKAEIVKAPEGAEFFAPQGLTVTNNSGNPVSVNGNTVNDGDSFTVPTLDDETVTPPATEGAPGTNPGTNGGTNGDTNGSTNGSTNGGTNGSGSTTTTTTTPTTSVPKTGDSINMMQWLAMMAIAGVATIASGIKKGKE
jgi:hypothetical protein